jgi:exopolysaccharide biosynthesis protein
MEHRRKKKEKKRDFVWPIVILLLLVIIGVGAYYGTHWLLKNGGKSSNIAQTSNSPKKTDQKTGYVSKVDNTKVQNSSGTIVADAGIPEWVKVPSDKKLAKFTELSKNGLTIYRINNPEVLKTTQTLQQPLVRMDAMVAQYPDSLIMNASAFMMGASNEVAGLQINNGQLLRDWAPTGLNYAFVINKDGSCKIYDSTTPASKIISDGGAQSYDFGAALIRDGQVVPSDGSVNWEIHAFIANDKDNNLYVILSDTNAGYDNIMAGVSDLYLENMLLLDSGGSSQLSVRGKTIVPSQDNRAVPDYIVMK